MSNRKRVSPNAVALEPDMRDAVVAMGKHWGLLLVLGLVTAGFGVALLVWPGRTLVVVAAFVGAYLLVSGCFQVVSSFTTTEASGGMRVLLAISGLISILLGMFAFRSVAHSLGLLALIIGIGWLMQGIAQTVSAVADPTTPGRGLQIFLGLLSVVAGFVVLLYPINSLTVLAVVGGIWMIVLGLAEVFGAFRVRGAARRLA